VRGEGLGTKSKFPTWYPKSQDGGAAGRRGTQEGSRLGKGEPGGADSNSKPRQELYLKDISNVKGFLRPGAGAVPLCGNALGDIAVEQSASHQGHGQQGSTLPRLAK